MLCAGYQLFYGGYEGAGTYLICAGAMVGWWVGTSGASAASRGHAARQVAA